MAKTIQEHNSDNQKYGSQDDQLRVSGPYSITG